mmetsp:Transcript_10825/g.13611  ORF Transcript_10825/g.13611 Transcript_10825/m.13611 type:complete len:118 (+) Transcript_10825:899-1252(+)
MVVNEDEEGSNPYAGGHEDISADLVSRKRNYDKERRISPVSFNPRHKTSTRQDDKVAVSSLNQFNAKQLAMMMLKKQVAKRQLTQNQMDFLFMNEPQTIDVIKEESRHTSNHYQSVY